MDFPDLVQSCGAWPDLARRNLAGGKKCQPNVLVKLNLPFILPLFKEGWRFYIPSRQGTLTKCEGSLYDGSGEYSQSGRREFKD